jgi:hypothetical protein
MYCTDSIGFRSKTDTLESQGQHAVFKGVIGVAGHIAVFCESGSYQGAEKEEPVYAVTNL